MIKQLFRGGKKCHSKEVSRILDNIFSTEQFYYIIDHKLKSTWFNSAWLWWLRTIIALYQLSLTPYINWEWPSNLHRIIYLSSSTSTYKTRINIWLTQWINVMSLWSLIRALKLKHFWATDVNRKWTICIIGQWFGSNSRVNRLYKRKET